MLGEKLELIQTNSVIVSELHRAEKPLYLPAKRVFDIVLSFVGILIASPIVLIAAILIMIDDWGSPFYLSRRVGKGGKDIGIIKLRTMKKHADRLEDVLSPFEYKLYKKEFKLVHDPRITKLGHFLRKSSIDELPQLVNVFLGNMSLVGPRPILYEETLLYGERRAELLSMKPGLTGYWQAYKRNNATYETGERQRMELHYIEAASFAFDMKIFLKTFMALAKKTGAL